MAVAFSPTHLPSKKNLQAHSVKEFLDLLLLQLDLHDKYSKEIEPRPFKPLLRFFKIYIRGFRGAGELRNRLMDTKSTDEVRRLVQQVLEQELD